MTWFSRDVLGLEPAGEDESVTFQRLATHGRDLVEVYPQEHRDVRMRLRFRRAAGSSGGVAERSNAAVSKTVGGRCAFVADVALVAAVQPRFCAGVGAAGFGSADLGGPFGEVAFVGGELRARPRTASGGGAEVS